MIALPGRTVHTCCAAGLRVVAVARRKDRLEALQAHMAGLGVAMANFLPVVCDITKDAEVGRAGPLFFGWRMQIAPQIL